ncbi:FHA domain-containing protein FhaB/FipA [Corynebacterium cystitidis]|uniref:FHA domain-containing protein n=1 Tax=Corynebacterium cystitidis DSM 20524 TaxID=1121357 RepID=A0A1H9UN24_9CORY|nr:FHA domain-containing protein [Corynebacterium cystitidis]WJY81044.1 FHA domain-containing protein FhaB [Corynebacterium cystitidis DSM 20524]SES10729.1 FHA domain-containing protein [Corynebacterium cystitidis DSM 20524]SNV90452.1 FHA-domain-containing protein [Corynebacterium cystitidis]
MDSVVLLLVRFGLLVLLWILIIIVILALRRDVKRSSGTRHAAVSSNPIRREKARAITVVEGPLKGSHMNIASIEAFTLGRSNENDFVLGDDFSSSRHARLFRRGSDWFVEDLDSRNGTFVGGTRIEQPERVSVGTDIKMGRTIVRLIP